MSSISSAGTRSQRPLEFSSRSPLVCIIWRSMTTPSVERILHHCVRSEKMQRAVGQDYHSQEEGLSSCLPSSVSYDGTERPVLKPFDSQCSRNSEPQLRKMCKSGFFWDNIESRFSLIIKQRFKTRVPVRLGQKKYSKNDVVQSQRGDFYRAHQGDKRLRQVRQLLHEQ